MAKADSLVAEAKAFASAARKAEEQEQDPKRARKLYLEASGKFLEASKLTDNPKEKAFRAGMAETFFGKATALKPERSAAASAQEDREASASKVVPVAKPKVSFADVGGLDDVKEEIRKAIVYPFEHPELYKMYGKKSGEGILFYGPPGCGKTFIAKASAGECNVSFLNLKISDILSKFLGESEQNLRAAFDSAGTNAPCILFFDEIDALGGRRDEGAAEYSKRLVNEFLTQMDGFEGPRERVLVISGTNAPWDVDPALRRPGRFSKLILIPPPDATSREAIFRIHLKDRPIDPTLDVPKLAMATDAYSSADIAQLCSEAADIPLTEALSGRPPRLINQDDFTTVMAQRTSSIIPWFRLAIRQIEGSGEEDLFAPLLKICRKFA